MKVLTEKWGLTGWLVWIKAKLLNWANSFIISSSCSSKESISPLVFGIPGWHLLFLDCLCPLWSTQLGLARRWCKWHLQFCSALDTRAQAATPCSSEDFDYFCWNRCNFDGQTGKIQKELDSVLPGDVIKTNINGFLCLKKKKKKGQL